MCFLVKQKGITKQNKKHNLHPIHFIRKLIEIELRLKYEQTYSAYCEEWKKKLTNFKLFVLTFFMFVFFGYFTNCTSLRALFSFIANEKNKIKWSNRCIKTSWRKKLDKFAKETIKAGYTLKHTNDPNSNCKQ